MAGMCQLPQEENIMVDCSVQTHEARHSKVQIFNTE